VELVPFPVDFVANDAVSGKMGFGGAVKLARREQIKTRYEGRTGKGTTSSRAD
jgi:hypothetical protein